MKSFAWSRCLVTFSLLALGACGGSSSEEETSSDAVSTFVQGAVFREKVEACDAKTTPAFKFACLVTANDAENEIIDRMQAANYPMHAFNGYRTSDIPTYRDAATKLCNALAGKPVDGRESSETAACLAQREHDLSTLILETVYGEPSAPSRRSDVVSACEKPLALTPPLPSDRALKDAGSALERWSDCVTEGFIAAYRPKVSATFESCAPPRHDETEPTCRTLSVLEWAVGRTAQVCRVLGTAGHAGNEYEIAVAQNECVATAVALLVGGIRD